MQQTGPPEGGSELFYHTIMENNYAEKTGEDTIAIHCDVETAERIYEGICKIFVEYPTPCPANWRVEKRNLSRLKIEIEGLLPSRDPG